jgi:hypothetical protein
LRALEGAGRFRRKCAVRLAFWVAEQVSVVRFEPTVPRLDVVCR